jgi:hypothetical protein
VSSASWVGIWLITEYGSNVDLLLLYFNYLHTYGGGEPGDDAWLVNRLRGTGSFAGREEAGKQNHGVGNQKNRARAQARPRVVASHLPTVVTQVHT